MEYTLLSETGHPEKVSKNVIDKSIVWSTAINNPSYQAYHTKTIITKLSDNDLVYMINLLEKEPYTYETIAEILNQAPFLSQAMKIREIANEYGISSLISFLDTYIADRITEPANKQIYLNIYSKLPEGNYVIYSRHPEFPIFTVINTFITLDEAKSWVANELLNAMLDDYTMDALGETRSEQELPEITTEMIEELKGKTYNEIINQLLRFQLIEKHEAPDSVSFKDISNAHLVDTFILKQTGFSLRDDFESIDIRFVPYGSTVKKELEKKDKLLIDDSLRGYTVQIA